MRLRGNRRARWVALALIAATLGVLGVVGYRRALFLYHHLGSIFVKQLEQQLGREVAIGRVDASRPGRLILWDVAIAAHQRVREGTLLRAPNVVILYRPLEILLGSH